MHISKLSILIHKFGKQNRSKTARILQDQNQD